ncbi:MAG: EthD family reductase [Sphingomonadales bacterium]|nr:EthD family reductase [Sphingomonadales bacterium]
MLATVEETGEAETMIAAISMMRRRSDISLDQFRRHWLDPHGVMTAELPGVRYYIQSHSLDAPGTNALAKELAIDGFPQLWFDSIEARRIAYTSPRIAECNIDSEHFVGAVSRLVAEPEVIVDRPAVDAAKVILIAIGAPDPGWADRLNARVMPLEGLVGYVRHTLLEQAAAPASKIPELKVQVAGIAEVSFEREATLLRHGSVLAGASPDAARTAIYRVRDYKLV